MQAEQRPLRAELQAPESSRSVEQDGTIHIEGSQHSQAELEQPPAAPLRPPPLPPPLLPRRLQQPVWDERGRTTLVINLASIMERVDEQLLPALYSRVGASFSADPEHLGILTFARAVVQALASPLAGVLGHYVNRVWVITAGAALWGCMCLGFAFTHSIEQVGAGAGRVVGCCSCAICCCETWG